MKAFNYFLTGQRSKVSNIAEQLSSNDKSSELSGRQLAPQSLPVVPNGDSAVN
jgi:hypothetical protein